MDARDVQYIDADAWTLETYNDKILGIGRYYEGEKLLALFNFSENDETAWINEEEDYIDLITGEHRAAKAVGVPAHDFAWLYYNFNPKPAVKEAPKAEEAPAEAPKVEEAPAEEPKTEEAPKVEAAPAETSKLEEVVKKVTRRRTAKKADDAEAEAPKKTTRKRATKKAETDEAARRMKLPKLRRKRQESVRPKRLMLLNLRKLRRRRQESALTKKLQLIRKNEKLIILPKTIFDKRALLRKSHKQNKIAKNKI